MSRKKMRHLLMEISRQIQLKQTGTLRGWGKIARFYGDSWLPNFDTMRELGINSYKELWECDAMVALRKSVGM